MYVSTNFPFDAGAARRTFREALECGGDRATALGVRGKGTLAPTEQASHAAGHHDSATLPKRWLSRHRTPKCVARKRRHVSANFSWLVIAAARRTFREALECGGDRATALGVRGKGTLAPTEQASHAAGHHDSATLPKRWLGRHRTPKCVARKRRHVSANFSWLVIAAARRPFREALECGGDRATALGVRGKGTLAPTEQASHAAGHHDSATLPKRWLSRHRTPKCVARKRRHVSANFSWLVIAAARR